MLNSLTQRMRAMVILVRTGFFVLCASVLATSASAQQLTILNPSGLQTVGSGQGERTVFFNAGTVAGAGTIDLVAEVLEATQDSTLQIIGGRPAVRATGQDDIYIRWSLFQAGTYDVVTDTGGVPVTADIFVQINDVDGPNNEEVFVPVCDGTVDFVRIDAGATTDRSFGTVGSRPDIFTLIGDSNYNQQPESGLEISYSSLSTFEFGRTANNGFLIRVDNPTYSAADTLDFECGDFVAPTAVDDVDSGPLDTPIILSILDNDSAATANDNGPNNNSMAPSEYASQAINLIPPAGATGVVTDAAGDVTGFTVPGEGTWSVNDLTGEVTFTPVTGFTGQATVISYNYDNALGATSNDATISVSITDPPPVAVDDPITSPSVAPVSVDPLGNDTDPNNNIDPTTVTLVAPLGATAVVTDADGDIVGFTVPGEGTWSVNETTGEVSFAPATGVFTDPTPVDYSVDDLAGNTSNDAQISIDYMNAPAAVDDSSLGNAPGSDVSVTILSNDTPSGVPIDLTSVSLTPPAGATNVVTDADGDVVGFEVPGEGVWSVDPITGVLLFEPEAGVAGNPTPITYTVENTNGDVSNPATVTIGYVAVSPGNLPPFQCESAFYEVISGRLNQLDPISGNYTPIGPQQGNYNGTGYNVLDNYIYGLLANNLIRVGSDGNIETVFALGDGSSNGAMDFSGNLYYDSTATTLDVVNVSTPGSQTVINFTGSAGGGVLDFAYYREAGKEYMIGANGSELRIWNLTDGVASTQTVPSGMGNGGYGGAWAAADGRIYFSNNGSGTIYVVENPLTAPQVVTTFAAARSSQHDGMSCDLAFPPIPFPPVAEDDSIAGVATGAPGVVDVLSNDSDPDGTVDPTSVSLFPNAGTASNIVTDAQGDTVGFDVAGEGSWSVDPATGEVTFTPLPTFFDDPTPIDYTIRDNDGNTSDPAMITIEYVDPVPALEIVKSVLSIADTNNNGVTDPGDTVTFGFTAENTGQTALANVSVTDAGLSPITVTPEAGFDGDLAIGEGPVAIAQATYVLTPADVGAGEISNSAQGTGTPVETDPATGNPIPGSPYVGTDGNLLPAVTDTSDTGTEPDLDPAGNPVPVSDPAGTDTDGTPGNDADEPTVLVLPGLTPDMAVVKSITGFVDTNGSGVLDAGDIVSFSFTAENTGDTALANVSIQDAGLSPITVVPDAGFDGDLAIGEGPVVVAAADYTLTAVDVANGGISNTASGSGDPVATNASGDPIPGTPLVDGTGAPLPSVVVTSDAGTEASIDPATGVPATVATPATTETPDETGATDGDPANDPTALILPAPGVSVVKSVAGYTDINGNGVVDAGDRVDYAFAVTNTGNTVLNDVAVTDGLPGIVITGSPVATLAIGATDSTSITAQYTLMPADIAAGGVENTATATGTAVDAAGAPYGDPFNPGSPLTTSGTSDAGTDPDGNTLAGPNVTETPGLDGTTDGDPANDPTVFLITPAPSLTVVKSIASVADVNGSGSLDAGDRVTYSFVVTNTGNVALRDVVVTDPLATVTGGPATIAIGADDTTTFGAVYELTAADVAAGGVENTAEVTGVAADAAGDPIIDPITGDPLTATDDSDSGTAPLLDNTGAPVTQANAETTETPGLDGTTDGDPANDPTVLIIPNAAMTVVKSVSVVLDNNIPGGDGLFGGDGDEIVYQFTVTNTGNVDLQGITLTDPNITVSGGPIDLAVGAGDSLTFTGSYTVVPADTARGYIENSASATGNAVDATGTPIYGPGGAPVTTSATSDAGTDPATDPVTDPTNTETPDGTGGTDGNPGNDPTVTAVPGNPTPRLSVIKSVASVVDTSGDGLIGAGDTVTYSFVVTNTGNVRMENVTVTDATATMSGGPVTLAVGDSDSTTFSATSVITPAQAAAGAIENTATATGAAINSSGDPIRDPATGDQLTASDASDAGTDPEIGTSGTPTAYTDPLGNETPDASGGTDADPTNDPTVLFLPRPAMSVVKSVASVADTNGNGFTDPGDTISYAFAVTNTGNTDLVDIAITDALPGVVISGSPIASLAQGATNASAVTATYVLTAADIAAGAVENTAQGTATAVDSNGDPLGDPTNPGSPLTVSDTSDAGTDADGDPVTDPTTTETPDSTGGTDGDPSNDPTVFAVPPAPMLELVKAVDSITDVDGDGLPSVGDVVNYTFSVTNTGNVDVADVAVNDLNGVVSGGPISLDIGQTDSTTFTMVYVITAGEVAAGTLVNTATVSGTAVDSNGDPIIDPNTGSPLEVFDTSDAGTDPELGPDGTPVDVTDPATTETGTPDGNPGNDPTVLAIPNPELTVIKSVANVFDTNNDGLFGGENDEVVFRFLVTNTGNVDLADITISDSLATVSGGPIDLAVGQGDSLSFTASYFVTAADLALGYVENTATGTGGAVDSNGDPILGLGGAPITVSDTSDAGTDPDGDPITDPSGTETPDGTNTTDGDPGNDPTVLSVPANAAPRLSVIKSVASITDNGDGVLGAGDTVTYSFVVTNTGNVDLAGVMVTDSSATVSGGPIDLALGASDSTTFAATRVITAAEAASGAIENSAGATGGAVNSLGDPITEPGGGAQLTATDVSDAGTAAEFGPTGTPQAITDPEGNETPDATGGTDTDPTNDPTTLFIPAPGLEVIKLVSVVNDTNGDGLYGGAGDVIEYTFGVINTGNTDLVNIVVTDATATVTGGPLDLAAGASNFSTFAATYVVTAADFDRGYVENTATGFGDVVGSDGQPLGNPVNPGVPLTVVDTSDAGSDPSGAPISDPSGTETPDGTGGTDGDPTNDPTVTTVPANPEPRLSIIKSVIAAFDTDGDAVVGGEDDELVYEFIVSNTGNVELSEVVVNDAQLGGVIATIPNLVPGDSVTLTRSYIITAADQANGFVENTATATGNAVNGLGEPLRDPATGDPLVAVDDSDAGSDPSLGPITDPEFNETPNQAGGTDSDPTNDPTVTVIPLAVPDTGISGTFYVDGNDNGDFDAGDTPLAGILVQIIDANGRIIASTTTDANGFYEMEGFAIGTHNVSFIDPLTGEVLATLDNLTFDRNTVLTEQDQRLVQPVTPDRLVVTKTTPMTRVMIGTSVPYVITIENPQAIPFEANIVDQLPAGFAYTPGSGTINGVAVEPVVSGSTLTWGDVAVGAGQTVTVELIARVGPSAPTGDLVNVARTFDPATGEALSPVATATVTRSPEAVFDCSDIIGKVFDDVNMNGYQDGPFMPDTSLVSDQDYDEDKYGPLAPVDEIVEPGLPGVRLITTNGLIITTDEYGRFSVPCAALPGDLGANFTLKVDDTSLPTGYRMTTENPRTMRVTAGIMTEMNFGASIGRVVDIDLTAAAFTSNHQPVAALANGLDGLLGQVRSTPSILRISYFTNGEGGDVAQARLDALEAMIRDKWSDIGTYRLIIERTVSRLQ